MSHVADLSAGGFWRTCFRAPGSDRLDPWLVGLWASLLGIALLWFMPFVFIVFTSLKDNGSVMGSGAFAVPQTLNWSNYSDAWIKGNFSNTFVNSLLIAVVKVPLGLLISALAAYALARMRFRSQKALLLAFVLGTMIPFQIMLAPLFGIVSRLGLLNTYLGEIGRAHV